jgi:hypothetical protein
MTLEALQKADCSSRALGLHPVLQECTATPGCVSGATAVGRKAGSDWVQRRVQQRGRVLCPVLRPLWACVTCVAPCALLQSAPGLQGGVSSYASL